MRHDELLIDNDVIVKLVRWGLATDLLHHCCATGCTQTISVLATARWVCRTTLERAVSRSNEDPSILSEFDEALLLLDVVEPDPAQLEIAASLEDQAIQAGLPLDPGESILAAISTSSSGVLLTGDKRAIEALELLLDSIPVLDSLRGRVAGLEHAMMSLLVHLGDKAVGSGVGRAPAADTAMRLVFLASTGTPRTPLGLQSYIDSLVSRAPRLLTPAHSLCSCELRLSP